MTESFSEYPKYKTPRKTKKIMRTTTKIAKLRASLYPAKAKEHGRIILGAKL
jgi:hypothetical protein